MPADMLLIAAPGPGLDGFLGTRGSLMLDLIVVAMLVVLVAMTISIGLARYRQNYRGHKMIQIILAFVLMVAIVAFEIDVRFLTDWESRAAASPYFQTGRWNPVWYSLVVHLAFAIPTPLVWAWALSQAVRRFPQPPAPGPYSPRHRIWGRIAAACMVLTAVTGWLFYWLAFVATS